MKKIDTHGRVEKPSKQVILEAVIWIVLIAFAASTIIVIAEEGMEGAKLTSITEGLWFMYATITTIGYGDVTPVTGIGRATAVIAFLLGALNLARLIGGLQQFFKDENEVDNRQIYSALAEHSRILQKLEKNLPKKDKITPDDHEIDYPLIRVVIKTSRNPHEFAAITFGNDSTGDYVVSIVAFSNGMNMTRWLYADDEDHAEVLADHHIKLWEDVLKDGGHAIALVKTKF